MVHGRDRGILGRALAVIADIDDLRRADASDAPPHLLGYARGSTNHLVQRREHLTLGPTVERDLGKRLSAQRFPVFC